MLRAAGRQQEQAVRRLGASGRLNVNKWMEGGGAIVGAARERGRRAFDGGTLGQAAPFCQFAVCQFAFSHKPAPRGRRIVGRTTPPLHHPPPSDHAAVLYSYH